MRYFSALLLMLFLSGCSWSCRVKPRVSTSVDSILDSLETGNIHRPDSIYAGVLITCDGW